MRNRGRMLAVPAVLTMLTVPIQASDATKSLARAQEAFASLSVGLAEAQTNVVNPAGITVVESGFNINDQGGVINLCNAQGAIVGSLGTDDFSEGGLALFDRFGNPRSPGPRPRSPTARWSPSTPTAPAGCGWPTRPTTPRVAGVAAGANQYVPA